MQVRITRPVVISTAAGLRYLAPGLTVNLSENEAAQVARQKAGGSPSDETAPVKTPAKTPAKPNVFYNEGTLFQRR